MEVRAMSKYKPKGPSAFEEAVQNAQHHIALGKKSIWLDWSGSIKKFPWDLVTKVDPQASLDRDGGWASASVDFSAEHPCGLEFTWHMSLSRYDYDTDGNMDEKARVDRVVQIMCLLPTAAKPQFQSFVEKLAEKLKMQGDRYSEMARSQYRLCKSLEDTLRPTPSVPRSTAPLAASGQTSSLGATTSYVGPKLLQGNP